LWAAHVVHHSSEDFNLSTALRQSSTNQVFYWLFYLPMAIVGIPVTVFVIIALISVVYQFGATPNWWASWAGPTGCL
jgi:sterol desaturase/sphingolipid hydroxylase (fatty acid hydroxylase superfamily)